MNYIDHMKQISKTSYDELYRGVHNLVFTDFPDYPNVGDSAIALGQLRYFSENSINVDSAYCIATLTPSVFESTAPVMINGGGNIAGLFEGIDKHRNSIAQNLRSETLLIQAPQSVHFATENARLRFTNEFASRSSLRMSVRDRTALEALREISIRPILAPDAVHHLGEIPAPEPSQSTVILARRDQESDANEIPIDALDWKKDTLGLAITSYLRWKSIHASPVARVLNKPVSSWQRIAQQRLDRGVGILSQGETVITDRLHAMLISLQMGRRVIAVDNNNHKLTKYADSWFSESHPDIKFAKSFSDAIKMST